MKPGRIIALQRPSGQKVVKDRIKVLICTSYDSTESYLRIYKSRISPAISYAWLHIHFFYFRVVRGVFSTTWNCSLHASRCESFVIVFPLSSHLFSYLSYRVATLQRERLKSRSLVEIRIFKSSISLCFSGNQIDQKNFKIRVINSIVSIIMPMRIPG